MNTSPASVASILGRLSIGVSRTSIRHYGAPRLKKKKHHLTGFEPGHGEKIFVYNHIENGMIIYSHEPELKRDSKKYLSQIPFTVKKQKPAELRHDYWQPLCMIQFDVGKGVVGRNVFQKLQEFRALHQLQWGWQAETLRKLSKEARGQSIHNQKPNAVADIAAVLAGAGRGNLMWTTEPMPVKEVAALEPQKKGEEDATATEGTVAAESAGAVKDVEAKSTPGAADSVQGPAAIAQSTPKDNSADAPAETKAETSDTAEVALTTTPSAPAQADETAVSKASKMETKKAKGQVSPPKRLLKATIYWANDIDLDWARKWSDNVIHELGLPEGVKVWNWKTKLIREVEEEAPEDKAGVKDGEGASAAGKKDEKGESGERGKKRAEEGKSGDEKKGWLGWVGGKASGSAQDARA